MRHKILMRVRMLLPLLAAMLGGCAVLDFLPDWSADRVAGPEPPYRFIVANRINEILGREGIVGTLQISGVRRVDSLIYLHRLLKLWVAPHVLFTSIMLTLMAIHVVQVIYFNVR